MIVYRAQLSRTLRQQAPKAVGRQFERRVRQAVEQAQQMMLADFAAHPVTQEIAAGPNSSNMSNTLLGGSPAANLFSFIGFDAGANPVDQIRSYLAQNLRVNRVRGSGGRQVSIFFEVKLPSLTEVYNLTPLPWAPGLSWAEGIEKGIPGLGQYLSRSGAGRSGGGIQAGVTVNGANFRSVPYLSKILKEFVNYLLSSLNT